MPGRFNPDDYVDVQERINRFWAEYPNGAIFTELDSSSTFDAVVFRALVFKQRPESGGAFVNTPDATGYASEMKGGNGANATSWHENGETSAIGRALANMGYATTREDRPSRQEMNKVARRNVIPREAAPPLEPAEPAQSNGLAGGTPRREHVAQAIDSAPSLDVLNRVSDEIKAAVKENTLTGQEANDLLGAVTSKRAALRLISGN